MVIYRLDEFGSNSWRVKWFSTKDEAVQYQTEANRAGDHDWDLEEYEINESINAFVGFLNFHAAQVTDSN